MSIDLFGQTKPEIIRTLGFYQPFCSLMLHGKKETRWVRQHKKPPFPKGKYLLYSTKKPCSNLQLFEWCGPAIISSITEKLKDEPTKDLHGYAIAIGELENIREMYLSDQQQSFVKWNNVKSYTDDTGKLVIQLQYCLEINNVRRIEPFEFLFGKQGVGKLPKSEYEKIKYVDN